MDFSNFFFQSTGGGPNPELIGNSLRFRGSQYLSRTPSTAGNRRTYTVSLWIKRGGDVTYKTYGPEYIVECLGSVDRSILSLRHNNATEDSQFQQNQGLNSASGTSTALGSHRDPSAWYHLCWVNDYNNSVAEDRMVLYVNGERVAVQIGSPYQSADGAWNSSGAAQNLGATSSGSQPFKGYMAEVYHVDGQALAPTDFGEFNADGVWLPKDVTGLTYGQNGFYLDFSDPNNIGADRSGNGNNFTATGFELTDTTSRLYDLMEDSPTNSYSTINALDPINVDFFDANLKAQGRNTWKTARSTIAMTTGKWYWEVTPEHSSYTFPGVVNKNADIQDYVGRDANGWSFSTYDGTIQNNNSGTSYGSATASGVVLGFAFDADTGKMWVRNASGFFNSGDPAAGTNPAMTAGAGEYYVGLSAYESSASNIVNFGQRAFAYTPPAGFESLSTAVLPAVAITDPSEHFQTILGPGPGTGSTTPINVAYKTSNTADSPSATYQDQVYGKPATDLGETTGVHPMFEWASRLSLEGHDDWYIPAKNELEILYRNLKPTTATNSTSSGANANAVPATSNYTSSVPAQTAATVFQSGGSEAFSTANVYRTSTEISSNTSRADFCNFANGDQVTDSVNGPKTSGYPYARAIRRVALLALSLQSVQRTRVATSVV
jgi:hypothetical protein